MAKRATATARRKQATSSSATSRRPHPSPKRATPTRPAAPSVIGGARPASGARKRSANHRSSRLVAKAGALTVTELDELNQLRAELERAAAGASSPLRWNADPDDVQRSVAKLVLTLVEFIRRLLERQAVRRMEAGTLTPAQIEAVGQALMKLEKTVQDIAATFGIPPDDLNLDLGPVGRLM